MFVLLSGSYPYAGSSSYELRDSIRNGKEPDMATRAWRRVSDEAKDLARATERERRRIVRQRRKSA